MSIEIDVLNGDSSWPRAEPLLRAVWPPETIEKLPWGHVKWAHADLRVLIDAPEDSAAPGLAFEFGPLDRIVSVGHVSLVMLVVVVFQRLLGHMGCKGVMGIGEVGQREGHG